LKTSVFKGFLFVLEKVRPHPFSHFSVKGCGLF